MKKFSSTAGYIGLLGCIVFLAACGGGGSSGGTPATAAPTATATGSPTPAPTTVPQTWTMQSSSISMTLTAGQTPASVGGVFDSTTNAIQFATPSQSGALAWSMSLPAAGAIATPNTLAADNATAGFTPQAYYSFYNGGTQTISFGQNLPQVTFASTPTGATTCALDVYANSAWKQVATGTVAPGSLSSQQVVIGPTTLPAGNSVSFPPGQQVVAVSCN